MDNFGSKESRIYKATAYFLFSLMLVFTVIEAKLFLYPLALSVLFAYMLYPVANFFERKLHIPRILSNFITLIVAVVFLASVFIVIYHQFKTMISDMPTIKRRILTNLEGLSSFIEANFGITLVRQKIYLNEFLTNFVENSSPLFQKAFSATTGTLVRIGLLPVFIFFMLYYRDKAYTFFMLMAKSPNRGTVKSVLDQISHVTKKYMSGVFVVVMILSVLNTIGLYIIGLEYAIFFGILSAFCNFIPYFGTIIGFAFPLIYAMITSGSPTLAIGVIGLFIVIQFTENNILTPNIVGDNVKLNPFIIILSLIVGAMVWGIPGMIVIVPLMAVFRIICENVNKLKPYAYLLGTRGTERHSLTAKKIKQFFTGKKKTKK